MKTSHTRCSTARPTSPEGVEGASSVTWTYDGLGQVTSANRGVININRTAIGGVPAEGERFVYDPIGNWNRYQKFEDGLGTLDQTRVHNTDNQITQVDEQSKDLAYDAAGNMTRTPVGVAKIVWDAWNRMIVAESEIQEAMAACVYDGLSRRTQLTSYSEVTEFYYNDVWKCVEEYENSGTSPSQIYYWGLRPGHRDELIRRGGGDSSVRWCVMDYFDPITILDEDGIAQERYGYTAFGEVEYYLANFAPKTSGFSNFNFLFHGQFRDAETGWYDYGFRYYLPVLGRWANRDPIGERGGSNLYSSGNSFINIVDHIGLSPECPDCFEQEHQDAESDIRVAQGFGQQLQAIKSRVRALESKANEIMAQILALYGADVGLTLGSQGASGMVSSAADMLTGDHSPLNPGRQN